MRKNSRYGEAMGGLATGIGEWLSVARGQSATRHHLSFGKENLSKDSVSAAHGRRAPVRWCPQPFGADNSATAGTSRLPWMHCLRQIGLTYRCDRALIQTRRRGDVVHAVVLGQRGHYPTFCRPWLQACRPSFGIDPRGACRSTMSTSAAMRRAPNSSRLTLTGLMYKVSRGKSGDRLIVIEPLVGGKPEGVRARVSSRSRRALSDGSPPRRKPPWSSNPSPCLNTSRARSFAARILPRRSRRMTPTLVLSR